MVELILTLLQLAPHLVILLNKFDLLQLKFLLLLISVFVFLLDHRLLGLNLVLKCDLFALELRDLVRLELLFLTQLTSLAVVRLILRVNLELVAFVCLLQSIHLLHQLLVKCLNLLR